MEADKVQLIAEEALRIRSVDPTPIMLRALTQQLRDRLGWMPSRGDVRTALSDLMPEASGWILDLEVAPGKVSDSLSDLENWVVAGANVGEAGEQLSVAIAAESPESVAVQIARLLGVVEGDPCLELVSLDSLSKVLREATILTALRADHIEWAIDSVCVSAMSLLKSVKEGFAAVKSDRLAAACAERLETWPGRVVSEPVYSEAVARLLQIAALCKGPSVTRATLLGVSSLGSSSPVPKWLDSALALSTFDARVVREAVNDLEEAVVYRLLMAVSKAPLTEGSPRRSLLVAVAESTRRNLLAEPHVWHGIKLDVLAEMLELQQVGEIIESVANQSVVAPLVDRDASVAPAWRVLTLVGRWRRAARHVTVRHLQTAYRRDEPSALLLRQLVAAESLDLRASIESLEAQLLQADADRLRLETDVKEREARILRLQEEEEDLRRVLAHQSQVGRSALDAEINQGRMDVLRTLCAAAESVRAMVSLGGDAGSAAEGLLNDLLRQLDGFGVTVLGAVGERRPARPDIDETFVAQTVVEVVTPAYITAGAITPLRRAFVHVVEEMK